MATDFDKIKQVKQVGQPGTLFCMDREPNSSRIIFGSSDRQVYRADFDLEKIEPQSFGLPDPSKAKAAGAAKAADKEQAKQADAKKAKSDASKATQPSGNVSRPQDRHVSFVVGSVLAGKYVVSGGFDRRLIWWDRQTHAPVKVVQKSHAKWLRKVVATPDGTLVASIADDMVCRVWDVAKQTVKFELKGHKELTPQNYASVLHAAAVTRDGRYLATGDKVGHVVIWDLQSGKPVKTFDSPENYTWDAKQRRHSAGGLRSLAFSPDGKLLAVGGIAKIGNIDGLGASALIQIYDWQKGERTHRFAHDKHKGLVEHLCFHHKSEWLMAAGGAGGGFFLFMDLNANKFVHAVDAKMHVHAFALNEKSERVYAVGYKNLAVWDLPAKS